MAESEDKLYPQPGEVLEGKYEIERILGEGAMGAVVRARHRLRKAPVALKFMSPKIMNQGGVVKRFINEGVAASQIDSDHVLKILDTSMLPSGVPYLVMEYLDGVDLKDLLARDGTPGIDVPRAVHFVLQMLEGLSVAHRAGIVHRDMKPANCFVINKNNDPDYIKIVDFGISKVRDPEGIDLTSTNSALGTPLYMSPEQARRPKDVDRRSDIYAVAGILYELIAGHAPFVPDTGTFSELLVKLITEEPASLEETRRDLPSGFWQVVAKGLAKDPEARYQSAVEMGEALAPFSDERSDYVLQKLTRTPLPSLLPPTMRQAPASADDAGGTVLMDGPPTPPVASPAQSAVIAGTNEGTAMPLRPDATVLQPASNLPMWVTAGAAVVAVGVALALALGRDHSPDQASPDVPMTTTTPTVIAPTTIEMETTTVEPETTTTSSTTTTTTSMAPPPVRPTAQPTTTTTTPPLKSASPLGT